MITKRQKQILDYIQGYIDKNGFAPSLEEIKRHFRLSSFSTVHYLVDQLRKKGYLKKENFKARAIEIPKSSRIDEVEIPLLGLIAAGEPIEAIENSETIKIDPSLLSKHYALKVSGNSMIDEGIFDGDTLIVRQQPTAENGEKVVALINKKDATVKKFYLENNRVRLQPANPSFPPIFPEDIVIQGKVVNVIHPNINTQAEESNMQSHAKKFKFVSDEVTTLFNEDCLEVLKSIKDNSVDLIFVDPPYNLGKDFGNSSDKWQSLTKYIEWCQTWINECIRVLKKDGTFYLMNATQHMPYLDLYISSKLKVVGRIVWFYDSSGVQAKNKFGSLYEPILMAVKDETKYKFNYEDIQVEARTGAERKLIDYRKKIPTPYNTKKTPGNVWYFPRVRFRMPEYEDHPSQKPEALMERIILASSNPSDIILDPFAGTFTTCAVAKRLGRKTIGIEINEKYFKVGLRRLGLSHEYNGERLVKNKVKKTNNLNKKDHQMQANQLSFMDS